MQTVVTAEEASPHIRRVLRTLLPHELDKFEELVENGAVIGRYWDKCFFATALKACGHEPRESHDRDAAFEEVQKLVKARFGIQLDKEKLHPVELFCFDVRGNQTPRTNDVLAHLVVLVSEVRLEFQSIRTLSPPDIEDVVDVRVLGVVDEERALFV